MFIVFNKQKIYSYLVAFSTVVILFVIGFAVTNEPLNTLQTSTNIEENSTIINNQLNNAIVKQNNAVEVNENNNMNFNQNY